MIITTVALVSLSVLIASFVQVVAGFGFALLAVPVMAVGVDPRLAVVVSTVVGLSSTTVQATMDRSDVDRVLARRLTLAAFTGMPLGFVIFLFVDVGTLRVLLGAVVLVASVALARGVDLRHTGRGLDVGLGALSGVLATSLSTNGPPLVFGLHARRLSPEAFRATLAVVLSASGAVSLAFFVAAGRVDEEVLSALLFALPAMAVGHVAGRFVRPHVRPVVFRRLVLGLLVAAAITTIITGIAATGGRS
jgi:uncharacterized protein